MSFLSLEFLLFFTIVSIIYFLLPGKLQWGFLLIVSGVFICINSSLTQIISLVVFILVNYLLSIIMCKQETKKKPMLVFIILLNAIYLIIIKYTAFYLPILRSFGKSELELAQLKHSLSEYSPMGISYIALIMIAYMVEVYWGNVQLQNNLGKFATFTCFFPHIISGPIVKYKEYEKGLFSEKHYFSYDRVVSGIERIIWGVFKKLVISARAEIVVNTIYGNYQLYKGFYVPVGVAFYLVQMYADFSGLIDIVIGMCEILDIKMPENFKTPFYSESVAEFWRRWHITLGRFLKEYILFPMQMSGWYRKLRRAYKKKVGKEFEKKCNLPRYLTTFIAWFFIGFWHGGGWNYIFGVGIYMWIVTTLEDVLDPFFKYLINTLRINTECFSYKLFRRVRTFFLILVGESFFRAKSLSEGFAMWKNAFSCFNPWIFFDKSLYNLGLAKEEMFILFIGVLMMIIVAMMQQKDSARSTIARQNYFFRVALYTGIIALTVIYGYYGIGFDAAGFIYGEF